MREMGSLVTLACWWVQHPLLLLGVHLCGGNGERSIGGSPVLGGGFCCHPFPGAKLSVWVYVHGVWPYPVWRSHGSVFSMSQL